MARVIGRLFQTLHRSSRLASTADLEDHVRGKDVILLPYLRNPLGGLTLIFVKFPLLSCNWSVRLKLYLFCFHNSDVWLYESNHFHVDYLLCIDPVKTMVNQGPTGFLTAFGVDPFHVRDDSSPRELDNRT